MSQRIKCKGLDRNGKPCRCYGIKETNFCGYHQHMISYTSEMMNNLQPCTRCKKLCYLQHESMCSNCIDNLKEYREGERNRKTILPMCEKKDCQNTAIKEGFCGKHQLYLFEKKAQVEGYKVCSNNHLGCRVKLSLNDSDKCSKCLEIEEKQPNENKINNLDQNSNKIIPIKIPIKIQIKLKILPEIMNQLTQKNNNDPYILSVLGSMNSSEGKNEMTRIINILYSGNNECKDDNINKNKKDRISEIKELLNNNIFKKICPSKSCKSRKILCSHENFIGKHYQSVKSCINCREKWKTQDANRIRDRTDYYHEYDGRSERKTHKKEWSATNHYKVTKYWMTDRSKHINENLEGYRKRH